MVNAPRNAKPANALGMMAFAATATFVIIGGYRLLIKPYTDNIRRQNAEEIANFLYESKRRENNGENCPER